MNKTMKKPMSFMSLRKKLFSAAAMLLVASIMLVSTSYAWLVLSTAPEITGVTTQMGANGALEIVLLDTESYNDLSKIQEADFDESLTDEQRLELVPNLQWGNLLDLGDAQYGLSRVELNPSRLAIAQKGSDSEGNQAYSVNSVLLKTPKYSEGGRLIALETNAETAVFSGENFYNETGEPDYGVRAIGVVANKTEAEQGVDNAIQALETHMDAAYNAVDSALKSKGGALANIAVKIASKGTYTADDATQLGELATALKESLREIESAIRQMFVAYECSLGKTGTELATAKEAIMAATLPELKAQYGGSVTIPLAREGVTGDIIDLLEADKDTVDKAIADCNAMAASGGAITQDDILGAMGPLVEHTMMELNGTPVTDLIDGGIDKILSAVMGGGGLKLRVPTGSGIISDIADYIGDYTTNVTVENFSYGEIVEGASIPVTMSADTSVAPPYLNQCKENMNFTPTGGGTTEKKFLTDFYGYAIDMAFRINADNANLLLQTDSVQRIYSDSTNAATQGGGSYMEYAPNAEMSISKTIKLMEGVRVVFLDKERNVLGIAVLDTELEQDDYELATGYGIKEDFKIGEVTVTSENCSNYNETITAAEYAALAEVSSSTTVGEVTTYVLGKDAYTQKAADTKKYAVLKGVTNPQNSDYITKDTYDALAATTTYEKDDYRIVDGATPEKYAVLKSVTNPTDSDYITKAIYDAKNDTGAVTIDPTTGKVKAKLYLHEFEMVMSTENTDQPTGAISIGAKKDSAVITALEENAPKQVTALVYLDGSVVNNTMVAARGDTSMTGVLNLQFASDALLTPMNNQALFDGEDETQMEIIDPDENPDNQEDGQPSGENGEGGGADPADGT